MTTYSQALRELAEPRPVGDLVKRAIERAARITGIPYWRTFDLWYGKARRIDAHEAERIAAALQLKREDEARNEIHDLRTRLLKMESRLAAEATDRNRTVLGGVRPRLR
jgi:hypothetical protein